jgi:hypothetical protein
MIFIHTSLGHTLRLSSKGTKMGFQGKPELILSKSNTSRLSYAEVLSKITICVCEIQTAKNITADAPFLPSPFLRLLVFRKKKKKTCGPHN